MHWLIALIWIFLWSLVEVKGWSYNLLYAPLHLHMNTSFEKNYKSKVFGLKKRCIFNHYCLFCFNRWSGSLINKMHHIPEWPLPYFRLLQSGNWHLDAADDIFYGTKSTWMQNSIFFFKRGMQQQQEVQQKITLFNGQTTTSF